MSIPLMLLASLLGGGRPAAQPAKATAPAIVTSTPDAELTALRAKYVGKEVWVYGGGPLRCYTSKGNFAELAGPFTDPVKIVSLTRHRGTVNRIRRVSPDLVLKNPLLVRVQPPASYKARASGGGGNSPQVRPLEGPNCREFLLPFANEADMLLKFSSTPPSAATKKALAPFLKPDPQISPSELGLTHEQVLWLRGIPDEPRDDLNMLMKAQQWVWLGPPGYGDNVLHFQNDRVVKVEVPRMGP